MAKRKPSPRSKAQPPPAPQFEWKNHPVIVASGSAAATFLLSLAIFTQVVTPTQTAKLEIEILKAKDAQSTAERNYSASVETGKKLRKKLADLEQQKIALQGTIKSRDLEIEGLKTEVVDLKAGNLFAPGMPYPAGLRLVRIGMPASEIQKVYAGYEIKADDEDPLIVKVTLKDSPFWTATYFTDAKTKTISHVSFDMPYLNRKYSDDFLRKKLIETFGPPVEVIGNKTKHFKWNVGKEYSLYSYDQYDFQIMKRGQMPIYWAL